jgi:hypothetical protein
MPLTTLDLEGNPRLFDFSLSASLPLNFGTLPHQGSATWTRSRHTPKMSLHTGDRRVLMIGLDGAGKTALLYLWHQREKVNTIPTIGTLCVVHVRPFVSRVVRLVAVTSHHHPPAPGFNVEKFASEHVSHVVWYVTRLRYVFSDCEPTKTTHLFTASGMWAVRSAFAPCGGTTHAVETALDAWLLTTTSCDRHYYDNTDVLIWVVDSTQNTHTFAECTPSIPLLPASLPNQHAHSGFSLLSPLPAAEALLNVFQSEEMPNGVSLVVIATWQVLIPHQTHSVCVVVVVVVVVVVTSLGNLTDAAFDHHYRMYQERRRLPKSRKPWTLRNWYIVLHFHTDLLM